MQDKSLESLSAMMDGEVEEFELRRVIERSTDDQQLKDKWFRYHLAQDIMQGHVTEVAPNTDFASRVSAALASEPSFKATTVSQQPKASKESEREKPNAAWWKPVASMAVAASVTAIVLLGSGQFQPATLSGGVDFAGVSGIDSGFPQGRFGSELSTVSTGTRSSSTLKSAVAEDMGRYIQQHIDLASPKTALWQANWLPSGYRQISHQVTSNAEVLLYSNGNAALSINIEPLGTQRVSPGVVTSNELLALGVRTQKNFITVVGELSPQIAAKIVEQVGPASR
ncbi:MAG: MucB/RseB C-terminal domain-containing protein [Oceanospirillaceae bacterium]|nr:MucB/RseB C-terminal domain-containing protein [Oceanospirillaceae bacterium]